MKKKELEVAIQTMVWENLDRAIDQYLELGYPGEIEDILEHMTNYGHNRVLNWFKPQILIKKDDKIVEGAEVDWDYGDE